MLYGALFIGVVTGRGSITSAAELIPLNLSPIAVRGGIVGVPLTMPEAGEGLPATVRVELRDGDQKKEVSGRVVWLASPAEERPPRWTRSANPTVVRTVADQVDPRTLLTLAGPERVRSIDGALLLIDVPELSSRATLHFGNVTLTPKWIEPGADVTNMLSEDRDAVAIDPEFGASWSDDRPDPRSPFEWFRWTLFALRDGERVPAPPGDAASQLFARHIAELWLAGIARVRRQSEGIADAVQRWLTATVRWVDAPDAPPLAMWIADPGDLGSLLAILLDQTREDDVIASATLTWMDARTPLVLWIESDVAGRVTLGLANPMDDELVVKVQWLSEALPPLATLLPPRSVDRMTVDRPSGRPLNPNEPIVLALDAGSVSKRLAFAPQAVQAKPPSLNFGTFVAPLTLAEVQRGRGGAAPAEWATGASLRRRGGSWEIFAECLAPAGGPREDALTIETSGRVLTIRRDGTIDGDADALLEASVREYEDRWRVRVVFPDGWLPKPGVMGAVLSMGLRRDAGAWRTTAAVATPAFMTTTPKVEIDLSSWRDGLPAR